MTTLYRVSRPRKLKNDFITSFDTLFDQMLNAMYPNLHKGLNDDFFLKGSYPKCNINRDNETLKLEAAVPGMSKDDLSVEIKDGVLTISGKSKNDSQEDSRSFLYREIKKSSFQRSFRLSDDLDTSKVSAKVKNGIVEICIPFFEPSTPENKAIVVDIA